MSITIVRTPEETSSVVNEPIVVPLKDTVSFAALALDALYSVRTLKTSRVFSVPTKFKWVSKKVAY